MNALVLIFNGIAHRRVPDTPQGYSLWVSEDTKGLILHKPTGWRVPLEDNPYVLVGVTDDVAKDLNRQEEEWKNHTAEFSTLQ